MERRKLYRELNGARGIGSNASFYGARSWIERLDLVAELSGHEGCINTLCWSRNGELLASGSDDTQVNIHTVYPDFALNTRIDTGHTENIFSVKFMPYSSDRTILSAAGDAQVRIFDVEYASASLNSAANKSNRPLPPASAPAVGQHFFFGRRIVAGSDIVPLKRYSYTEDQNKVYRNHTSRVKRIVTEANPYTFLSCSEDGTVRQWDLRQPSEFYSRPTGRRRRDGRGRGYHGMTMIDDEDEDGLTSGGAPPLINYRPWGIELNAVSCSTSQPFYIALGGRNLHCFLHDRRMSGRDLAAERGSGRSSRSSSRSSSGSSATSTMDTATRCVRKFVPRPGSGGGWGDPHITSCKISDVHPDNLLVSWSGDGVYMFNINQSPEEPGSGSDKQGKQTWDTDERRGRDASDPGPSGGSSSGGRGGSTDEPATRRLRESGRDSPSSSSFPPPSSDEEEESEAETVDRDQDRDHTPSTPFPEGQFLTTAALLMALKQKLATLQTTTPSSPETEAGLANDIYAAATHTYRRIRRKILSQEQRDLEFLTLATLTENNSEFRRRRGERNERARERRKARDWVRAVGHYAHAVLLLGQVDDEEDFEELEYTRDVRYRVFKLACGVAAGGREGGLEVVRGEHGVGFGFGDDGDDGDEDPDEERMLREYFTDILVNASPQPILDPSGNALYNSESDLITSLRTLMHSPTPPPPTPHLKLTVLPSLLLNLCPPISTTSSPTPSISPTPSPPLHQTNHQPNPHASIPPSHHSTLYLGHANTLTIKDVGFLGQQDEYVVSGSDDGNFFIWDARSAQIVNILAGDEEVVNVVVGHPRVPVLAVAGIGCRVGIFGVEGGSTGGRGRMGDVYKIVARNEGTSGAGGREIVGDGAVRAVCVPS